MCTHASSDQVQNLHPVLKLAVLFSSLLSHTAPSVSFLVSQEEFYGWRNNKKGKQKVSMKLIASLAPAQAEIEAGVETKADQYIYNIHHHIGISQINLKLFLMF